MNETTGMAGVSLIIIQTKGRELGRWEGSRFYSFSKAGADGRKVYRPEKEDFQKELICGWVGLGIRRQCQLRNQL